MKKIIQVIGLIFFGELDKQIKPIKKVKRKRRPVLITPDEIQTGYYSEGLVHIWGGRIGGHSLGKTYPVINSHEIPDNNGYVKFKSEHYYGEFILDTSVEVVLDFESSR